jgi:hypothetical protein
LNYLLGVGGCIAVSVILVEVLVELLRGWQSRRIHLQFPVDVMNTWEDRSLKGYRKVLQQFLPLAMEISNRYYPGSFKEGLTDEEYEQIVERHFAFKLNKIAAPTSR